MVENYVTNVTDFAPLDEESANELLASFTEPNWSICDYKVNSWMHSKTREILYGIAQKSALTGWSNLVLNNRLVVFKDPILADKICKKLQSIIIDRLGKIAYSMEEKLANALRELIQTGHSLGQQNHDQFIDPDVPGAAEYMAAWHAAEKILEEYDESRD